MAASSGLSQSAWLPDRGHFEFTPRYIFHTYQAFWTRPDSRTGLAQAVEQHSALLAIEYGITDFLSADATWGYTWISTPDFSGVSGGRDTGFLDTQAGLRLRLLDEDRASTHWVPTLTLRAGAVIAGNYDAFRPFGAGDGAHGGEFSLLFGKTVPVIGTGIFGEAGYRLRGTARASGLSTSVPDDFFGNIGIFQPIGNCVLTFGYRHVQALGGSHIGDPGFSFPGLREVNRFLEAGLGYRDRRDWYYQIFGAWNVGGRNTGDSTLLAASVTVTF